MPDPGWRPLADAALADKADQTDHAGRSEWDSAK